MKGAQDSKQKKKQDLQVLAPFPGCLGRVINMFDLGNGVVATKMLTEKAHRDVSPVGKDRSGTFKMASNQFPAQIEDKQRDSQLRRNSPTKRSNSPTNRFGMSPVKMLMEQDMWKEGAVPDDEPLNVVARLMGLNDAPVHQSDFISGRRPNKEYQSCGFEENNRNVKPKKEIKCFQNQKAGTRHDHIWGGLSDQPLKVNSSKNNHQGKESSCEKRMSLVREKFAEAKRLATDEKLLHSKEFQEALQFLSSNKDMFLKFLDEPSPLLSSSNYDFQPVTPPSELKQITILKPAESMKRKVNIHAGRQLYSDANESEGNKCRHHQSLNATPADSTLSEPTRIVVLKPGLAKSHEAMIPVSPLSSSAEPDSEDDSMVAVDEIVSSRRLAKEITWQMRMRLKESQYEENSVSYEYHDTYVEDDSLSKSEAENAKEVSGEISEDLEFGTPTSGRSWDFLSRSGSPYSASCSSQASHRREPSVVKEAKRRILERWSAVSSTVSGEEDWGARRSTGTLGEMLTIPEVKKDHGEFEGITLEGTTVELDTEEPFLCLPRSRSLPVSLSYVGSESNRGAITSQEADNEKSKKSSSFRERVSSLFSKHKKSAREKLDPSGISSANDMLKNGSAVTIGGGSEGSNHFTLDNVDENAMQRLVASSCHANDVASISAKDISPLPSLGALGVLGESQGQPSPVSVLDLDGPFLCDNNRRLLYSSENFITSSPQALSRSPLIGSFSRSLSWEDPPSEVMSPNSLRLSRLFSKADEDQDSLTFIQKLVSFAGMDREGCILSSPLDPKLLDKLSDYQGEGIKLRERRSKERLLFDAVNEALAELTRTTELAAYPWGRACCSARKDCEDDFCNSAADEIWRVIRNWSILEKYPPGEIIERNLLVDMILKREVVETAIADTTRLETFELNMMVCEVILEDLLEEALVDLTNNT
ncbi:uncharacterized protein LOC100830114 [Brachypodium distachyon]|nr:uncharacterized protein LOC100830114 [Brachypodium distachyon]KQK01343.1 hypothetical protein BRADI_3g55287v3 [Brachypodium distachyon]KQK01344.1 hypothetical protein BRADI_3g55287v3 [Brachypodium distachyon]KQK01345.1 hypothetical protein BRADI_3g55287v3 [Brachypodium distachyon]PNT69433.1 hypothetical protein BRADI_3g55287v3 [Brachypodium distachyon]|eukprot:XP_003570390.1 uncharacterized protein LOC100830114 [Brachypodium distachyon]